MSHELVDYLFEKIQVLTAEFPDVQIGRFFGLNVLKVQGNTFAMVWKEGRVGVKVIDKALNKNLVSTPGACHWVTSGKTMSQWVLAPFDYNEDEKSLNRWLQTAYNDALTTAKP